MSDFFSYGGAAAPAPAPAAAAAPRAILGELGGEDWEKFIAHTARRRHPAGALIVQAGEADAALCFIASGRVELQGPGGGRESRESRGEGEVFGLLSFLDGAPSDVTVRAGAEAPVELLRLTPEQLQQLAAWQPRIAVLLLRDLAAHVAARLRQARPGD
ncbi:Cyclic nucleotide-binding domain-containing protein [Rubrivivax sp. A210]|uniref:Crp/Fnr family transcriptional regulator n=1 Tax=Rubrivivax sp. A210 TaxID=2772301 RepID=UPI001919605D|nr:cyclic nucleotide-binding domain-containing protein [Rubrivivax sp. A210]CAD5369878.1 Cyclic nucleotide-binding domain-containing protein [Rubrivivax sp. A210]